MTGQEALAPRSNSPGLREFVLLVAALMALNALAIDAMLPALPAIGEALGVAEPNRRQFVITAFLLGFSIASLLFGPFADRFGRRRLLLLCLFCYAAFTLIAGLAQSFELLLGARALQGVAAAGCRVTITAAIRDRYRGDAMARVMSLVTIVFMVVPMLAPFLGQAVIVIGTWRHIFLGLGLYALLMLGWTAWRLPESLTPSNRRSLSFGSIVAAGRVVLGNRASIGNTLATTFVFGGLFAFIHSVQQIVADVFGRPDLLPLAFVCIAVPMTLSAWVNARAVMRIGARRLLLGALIVFTLTGSGHFMVAATWGETFWVFVLIQSVTQACFGLIGGNASSLAMAPVGHLAGTALSIQGFITTAGGALIGFVIGQAFDGTTMPFLAGLSLCGAAALIAAWWANKGAADSAPHDPTIVDLL